MYRRHGDEGATAWGFERRPRMGKGVWPGRVMLGYDEVGFLQLKCSTVKKMRLKTKAGKR